MIAAGFGRRRDDPVFRQPEVIDPALHMEPCWRTLPPGGEGGIYGEAQGS